MKVIGALEALSAIILAIMLIITYAFGTNDDLLKMWYIALLIQPFPNLLEYFICLIKRDTSYLSFYFATKIVTLLLLIVWGIFMLFFFLFIITWTSGESNDDNYHNHVGDDNTAEDLVAFCYFVLPAILILIIQINLICILNRYRNFIK